MQHADTFNKTWYKHRAFCAGKMSKMKIKFGKYTFTSPHFGPSRPYLLLAIVETLPKRKKKRIEQK